MTRRSYEHHLPPRELWPTIVRDTPELRYPPMLNLATALLDTHVEHGASKRTAIVGNDGRMTYGDLQVMTNRIGHALRRLGAEPGDRVLMRFLNSPLFVATWLAVQKIGAIGVATMPMLRPGEIATILERARVTHAIVDARFRDDFDAAGGVGSVIAYDGDNGFEALEAAPDFIPVETGRDDVALIAFTSGTTGSPKGCVHYHRDILAPADSFARHVLKPKPGDRWACSAPVAFTFGLGVLLIFPWRFGGTAVTIETPGPKALLEAVARHKVTTLATAPTAYKAMLPMLAVHDIASLRTCVSAGEHLPASTWQAWKEATGIGIVDGIGATEMMHIFISASGQDIRPGSTGKAVPGYVAAVLDEAGAPMETGTGRLAVKGPTGCRYLDDPRQSAYVQGGRLFLVRRPIRRHDRLLGLQHRRARG